MGDGWADATHVCMHRTAPRGVDGDAGGRKGAASASRDVVSRSHTQVVVRGLPLCGLLLCSRAATRWGGGRPGLTVCAPERDAGWPRGGGAVLSAAATPRRPARRLITLLVLLSQLSLGTSCIIDAFGRGRGRSIYLRDAASRSRSIILRVDPQRQRRPSCAQAGGFGTYVSKDRDQHQCLCVYMVVSPASWRLLQLA